MQPDPIPDLGRTFGEAVRIVREARNESPGRFAAWLGVLPDEVEAWEADGRTPEPILVRAVAALSKNTRGSITEKTLLVLWRRAKWLEGQRLLGEAA